MSTPSQQDLTPPFDPTAYLFITGAQLLQYITGTSPYADKGLIETTTDVAGHAVVPDAVNTAKWQQYIWRRISVSSVSLYAWNPNAANYIDPNTGDSFLKWYPISIAGIPAGGILGYMIANNTITDVNIHDVSWGKITGAPTFMTVGSVAGGVLLGTYPNPTLAPGAVTAAAIANFTVAHNNLATQTGDDTQAVVPNVNTTLAPVNPGNNLVVPTGAATNDLMVVNTTTKGFTTQTGTTLWPILSVGAVGAANAIPQINAGATAWQMSSPASIVAAGQSAATNQFIFVDNVTIDTYAAGAAVGGTNILHGLGATPTLVRWVLRCTSADAATNYALGDELDISSFFIGGGGSGNGAIIGGGGTTKLFCTMAIAGNSANFVVQKKATNAGGIQITAGKWTAVCYARL